MAELTAECDGFGRVERLIRPDTREDDDEQSADEETQCNVAMLGHREIEAELGEWAVVVTGLPAPALEDHAHGDEDEPDHDHAGEQEIENAQVGRGIAAHELEDEQDETGEEAEAQ